MSAHLFIEDKEEGEETGDVLGECIVADLSLGDGALLREQPLAHVSSSGEHVVRADHLCQSAEGLAHKVGEVLVRLLATLFGHHLLRAGVPAVEAAADGGVCLVTVHGRLVYLVHSGEEVVVAGGLVLLTTQHLLVNARRVLQELCAQWMVVLSA